MYTIDGRKDTTKQEHRYTIVGVTCHDKILQGYSFSICLWVLLHVAGAERCSEALKKLEKKYDIVVNIQGDEPLIEPEIIDGIVKALQVCLLSYSHCPLLHFLVYSLHFWLLSYFP